MEDLEDLVVGRAWDDLQRFVDGWIELRSLAGDGFSTESSEIFEEVVAHAVQSGDQAGGVFDARVDRQHETH